MKTAIAMDELGAHRDGVREADAIYDGCFTHPASAALRSFNVKLGSRPLTRPELVLFLASMAAFNRHTIGGIAILAGRISDEIIPYLPMTGHEIGAYVLDAAVDEYGLRETVTHVELARRFAAHLGITPDEVEARENASAAALELGDALFSWYRNEPAAFSLGVHTASEATSVQEFLAWHDIFLNFEQYRFSAETPAFEYMRTHCVHESDHINKARICAARYLDVLPEKAKLVSEGARAYLELYQTMLHELDIQIFQ
ncbi:MAG: iron-containing redox enzyme family protein [Pseudomonadota bacterium]|nr:iron-containing redox enzyme family protein [Pseudomonadota bacterium]